MLKVRVLEYRALPALSRSRSSRNEGVGGRRERPFDPGRSGDGIDRDARMIPCPKKERTIPQKPPTSPHFGSKSTKGTTDDAAPGQLSKQDVSRIGNETEELRIFESSAGIHRSGRKSPTPEAGGRPYRSRSPLEMWGYHRRYVRRSPPEIKGSGNRKHASNRRPPVARDRTFVQSETGSRPG